MSETDATPLPAPAYRIDGRPATAAAFYAVACNPRRAVVVEACAGAGKTWMLVSRIVRALLEGAEPQQILAITFTRKAAGEMRTRLAAWLRDFAALDPPGAARALIERGLDEAQAQAHAGALIGLHERLLASGRAVEVCTFHAWFSQLLRAAPMDLLSTFGLRPDLELIDDLGDLRRPLMRRLHQRLLVDADRLADYRALAVGRGRVGLQKWLDAVWRRRTEIELADAAGTLEDAVVPAPRVAGATATMAGWLREGALHEQARALAQALAMLGMNKGKSKCSATAEAIGQALQALDDQAVYDGLRAALFTASGMPRKQLGDLPAQATLCDRLEEIAAAQAQQRAHEEHQRMVRLSRVLLSCLAELKRERGLIDMDDLERVALALLGDHSLSGWVQQRLDARLRHLLIDEFQDTSPLQWHALHGWLSAYAGAGGGGLPSVFIVGDPKQSIYRFRRAEPRVFEAAQRFVVEGLEGSLAACDHTRRNAPEVLAVVNRVFGRLRGAGALPGWRPHSTGVGAAASATSAASGLRGVFVLPSAERPPATPRGVADAAPPAWRDSLTTPRHVAEEQLREFEAAQVARAVAELVQAHAVAPGEIFVLSRKRASLNLVAAALQARHLPHVAPEPWQLGDLPEVQDLLAVLDVLASPGQALSLARALKSPLFGASDADLLAWSQTARAAAAAGRSNDGWQALMSLAEPSPALARARDLLLAWRAGLASSTPHDLLDRIVHEGDLLPRLAAAVPAEHAASAIDAVHALLAAALAPDMAHGTTVYAFVRAARSRTLKAAPAPRADAVQLLTVHGAKGLEARVVFVMDSDPERQKPETSSLLVDWPVERLRPARVAFVASEAECPPSLQTLLADERAAREREEINALYVAMTRARERLVFSRTPPHQGRPQGGAWQRVIDVAQPWTPLDATAPADRPHARVVVLPRATRPAGASVATTVQSGATEQRLSVRLGLAVHRVLEWAPAGTAGAASVAPLAAAAAAEFGAEALAVETTALRILHSPACAPFFDAARLAWAGNEVPIAGVAEAAGAVLRIDRLVRMVGPTAPWWVLDYKLQGRPQDDLVQRAQLAGYRRAVQALQPGETVRAAFITGQGELIELD